MYPNYLDEIIEKFVDYSPKSFGDYKSLVQTQIPTANFVLPAVKSYPKESPKVPSNIIHASLVVQSCSYVNLKQRGGDMTLSTNEESDFFLAWPNGFRVNMPLGHVYTKGIRPWLLNDHDPPLLDESIEKSMDISSPKSF